MLNSIALKSAALALLLASTIVGAAEAQTLPPDARRSGSCTGGLFTLSEGAARFHVTLDDDSSEPSILVVMRFINQVGTVVKTTRPVAIGPGGSASSELRASGLFRVQADTYESSTNINFSERRTVLCSLESGVPPAPGSAEGFRPIGPPVWVLWQKLHQ
jgi:hypothetical protein